MINSFYTFEELNNIGFKGIGENVYISRKVSIYGAGNIEIGNNVRIDDFCILSGNIILKNNIHISAYCALYGKGGIEMNDYSGLSPRCTVFSATDDFSGEYMIGPQNPENLTNVITEKVVINKYCQAGAGTVILPGVEMGEGSVCGAMSFINLNTEEWKIYAGSPAKIIKDRSKNLLNLISE